jgi:hypothetical protein
VRQCECAGRRVATAPRRAIWNWYLLTRVNFAVVTGARVKWRGTVHAHWARRAKERSHCRRRIDACILLPSRSRRVAGEMYRGPRALNWRPREWIVRESMESLRRIVRTAHEDRRAIQGSARRALQVRNKNNSSRAGSVRHAPQPDSTRGRWP